MGKYGRDTKDTLKLNIARSWLRISYLIKHYTDYSKNIVTLLIDGEEIAANETQIRQEVSSVTKLVTVSEVWEI